MTVRGLEGCGIGQFIYAILPSASYTSSGVSSSQCDAGGYASLTAVATFCTGTLATALRVWFQGSVDGGSTWYGLPMTNVYKTLVHSFGLNETTSGTVTVNAASLVNEATVLTTTWVYVGTINCPPPLVRAAWNITGASAAQTFGINCLLSMAPAN